MFIPCCLVIGRFSETTGKFSLVWMDALLGLATDVDTNRGLLQTGSGLKDKIMICLVYITANSPINFENIGTPIKFSNLWYFNDCLSSVTTQLLCIKFKLSTCNCF